jgi:hypothetical protein
MISEIANALFLTYACSEYLVGAEDLPSRRRQQQHHPTAILSRSTIILAVITLFVNVLDRITGAYEIANQLFEGFLHAPKIIFAAGAFVLALYIDVSIRVSRITWKVFLPKVGWEFLKVLPWYPFLAVLVSFVFLFVINIWEFLHLNTQLLNAPIYFGTLYGPFAWVYVHVKKSILESHSALPV